MQGSGLRVEGAGFRVQGVGCRVQGWGLRVGTMASLSGTASSHSRTRVYATYVWGWVVGVVFYWGVILVVQGVMFGEFDVGCVVFYLGGHLGS